jgi:hypothetical protein
MTWPEYPGTVSQKDRRAFTVAYMAQPRDPIIVGPLCTCSEFPHPHDAHTSELGIFEHHRSLRPKKGRRRALPR